MKSNINTSNYTTQELRELALNSLYFFGRAILGWDWLVPHVHGKVAKPLENPDNKRIQLTLPRGFLKTTFAAITYAMWRVLPPRKEYEKRGQKDPLHDPNARILIVQNSRDNARKRINVIRGHIEDNDLLQELFPEIIPDKFHGSKLRWSDTHAEISRSEKHPEATWEAAGIGTSLVSRHYSEIIEDDIIAPRKDDVSGSEAIPTRDEVEKAIGFHKTAISLLANPKDGRIINIGTRWSKYDVIQYIINEQMPPFVRIDLPAIDEDGEPTYPERFDLDTLESIKHEQGTYIYSSQYLNKPYDTDNMVFKPGWLQTYDEAPPREDMTVYTAVDPAISQRKDSDYTVVITAGITGNREFYVLGYDRERIDPSDTIDIIFDHFYQYDPEKIIVESVQYQQALAHFLEREAEDRGTYLPVEEWKPGNKKKKEARIRGLQPIAQRRKLFIRPYHRELRKELLDFPYSQHDDVSDALATIKINAIIPQAKSSQEQTNNYLDEILAELRSRGSRGDLPFKDQTAIDRRTVKSYFRNK